MTSAIRLLAVAATFVAVTTVVTLWLAWEWSIVAIYDGTEYSWTVRSVTSYLWLTCVIVGVVAGLLAAAMARLLMRFVTRPRSIVNPPVSD